MVSVSCCGASATGVAATVVTGKVVLPCSWESSTEHVEVGVGVAVGVVIARTNGIKWQQNGHEMPDEMHANLIASGVRPA